MPSCYFQRTFFYLNLFIMKYNFNIFSIFVAFVLVYIPLTAQENDVKEYKDVSYYVIAHQDDWQLFMGTNAANDIISGEKVVLIYLTAGDLHGNGEPYVPYYIIRETGATYSLHLLAENKLQGWCFEPYPTVTNPIFNGHPIRRYEYRNTVSYYLRVVDSDLNNMRWDHSAPGSTVDNSTNYLNWCDLCFTLSEILVSERVNHNTGWLNIPEVDDSLNPKDHVSHVNAGLATLYAVNYYLGENYPTALFVGYDTQNRPPNIGVVDAANEAGLSAAYNISLINHRIWNEWRDVNNIFQEWCGRNYYRVENSRDIPIEYYDCEWYEWRSSQKETELPIQKDGNCIIYPNPVSSKLTITVLEETDLESQIQIIDNKGIQKCSFACVQNEPLTIDVSGYDQGHYFVHITTKKGTVIKSIPILRE
jgi:hypothetical protein